MADVDTWAAVDDDNDLAPPDGWPEGQMPSSVNNCGRAMMGAIRRMYDKIVAGTLELPYLKLAGGTVTGNVAINGTGGVSLSGVQLRNIGSGLEVYHAGSGSLTSRGPGAAVAFGDRNQTSADWRWVALNDVAFLQRGGGGLASVVGAGASAGRLTAAHSMDTQRYDILGTPFAQRSGNAHHILDADGQLALALHGAAGGNTNYYRADTHNFQNNAGGGVFNIDGAGAVNAGSLAAAGNVTCASIGAADSITAGTGSTGGNITSTYPGQFIGNACNIGNGVFGNIDASDIDCTGDIIGAGLVGNTVHAYGTLSSGVSVAAPSIAASYALSSAGNCEAASYTRGGVPVFALTESEYDALEARIAHLETQLKERSYV